MTNFLIFFSNGFFWYKSSVHLAQLLDLLFFHSQFTQFLFFLFFPIIPLSFFTCLAGSPLLRYSVILLETSLSPACFFHSLCNLFLADFCGALLQCLKHIGRFNFYTDRVIFILILFLILHLVLRQFFNLCHLLCVSCNLLFCDVVGRGKLLADAFIIISESCYHNKI